MPSHILFQKYLAGNLYNIPKDSDNKCHEKNNIK